MSVRLKVTLAYDGTDFFGWQVQKNGRTVQGVLFDALERMHKHRVGLHAAGRTDSGVHAYGQVVDFETDISSLEPERFYVALNSYLPKDVRARCSRVVDDEFHARYSARHRTYRYYWMRGTHLPPQTFRFRGPLTHSVSFSRLNRLCRPLIGSHDFSTFTVPTEKSENRQRTVHYASFLPFGSCVVFEITANAFLWRMVRSIAGTLIELDKIGAEPVEVGQRLAARDHSAAGPSAPACGLSLHHVAYDDEYME
jgi:tRNA pseudouridine38-40 synthase